jgi:hypothetical protein
VPRAVSGTHIHIMYDMHPCGAQPAQGWLGALRTLRRARRKLRRGSRTKTIRVFQSFCGRGGPFTRQIYSRQTQQGLTTTKKTMSRPPGRAAAGLLISLVTLTTAQQTPSPSSLPNQYSPDKRIPQFIDLGLTAACGVLMLILLSLVTRPASAIHRRLDGIAVGRGRGRRRRRGGGRGHGLRRGRPLGRARLQRAGARS